MTESPWPPYIDQRPYFIMPSVVTYNSFFCLSLAVRQFDYLQYSQGGIIVPLNSSVATDKKPFLILIVFQEKMNGLTGLKKKKCKMKGKMICICTKSRMLDETRPFCQESNSEVISLYLEGSAILRESNKATLLFHRHQVSMQYSEGV